MTNDIKIEQNPKEMLSEVKKRLPLLFENIPSPIFYNSGLKSEYKKERTNTSSSAAKKQTSPFAGFPSPYFPTNILNRSEK